MLYECGPMYLFRTGKARKTDRKRCIRYKAKLKAKNRRRHVRLAR
jgi:hypothetical protein